MTILREGTGPADILRRAGRRTGRRGGRREVGSAEAVGRLEADFRRRANPLLALYYFLASSKRGLALQQLYVSFSFIYEDVGIETR
jgi:hypothetical protein